MARMPTPTMAAASATLDEYETDIDEEADDVNTKDDADDDGRQRGDRSKSTEDYYWF